MLQANIKNRTVFTNDNLEIMRGINSNSIDLFMSYIITPNNFIPKIFFLGNCW